jgi:hypothetical protein
MSDDTTTRIYALVGPGNGPGAARPQRDTDILKASMPIALDIASKEAARDVVDLSDEAMLAAGYLILTRDAIEMIADANDPNGSAFSRTVCGWCRRAQAGITEVMELPRYSEEEVKAHTMSCQHNPLVRERDEARAECERLRTLASDTLFYLEGQSISPGVAVRRFVDIITPALVERLRKESP